MDYTAPVHSANHKIQYQSSPGVWLCTFKSLCGAGPNRHFPGAMYHFNNAFHIQRGLLLMNVLDHFYHLCDAAKASNNSESKDCPYVLFHTQHCMEMSLEKCIQLWWIHESTLIVRVTSHRHFKRFRQLIVAFFSVGM